jgi:hypothetical protein
MATNNHKYTTRTPREKKETTNQHKSPRTPLSNKHNLQERRESDDETNYIPTIITGKIDMAHTSQSNKVSIHNLLNELRETINVNSRELGPPSEKHKVVLIGDSNIRGYVNKLKSLLNNNYELYSVIKPGGTTNELKQTAKEEIGRLSFEDIILDMICPTQLL